MNAVYENKAVDTSSEGALVAHLVALHGYRGPHHLRVVCDQLGRGQIERHQRAAERKLHCGCDFRLVID